MVTNIKYILLTALRDWLFAALMLGVIACVLIAHMLGGTALIENQEMTLSYTSASARAIVITGLIIFVCFHIRSAFDTKEIDVFLSRPITRSNLVLSYWIGFAALAFLLVAPTAGFILAQGVLNFKGYLFWSSSFFVECLLVVTLSLFTAFTLKSAVASTLVSMGCYVMARLMGFFIAVSGQGFAFNGGVMNKVIGLLSLLFPRLDSFAKSGWLIYGLEPVSGFRWLIVQALVLIPVLILATIADFRRKQF